MTKHRKHHFPKHCNVKMEIIEQNDTGYVRLRCRVCDFKMSNHIEGSIISTTTKGVK